MTTNVPPIAWDPTVGFIAPSQAAILAGVQADYNAAFGGGLNPNLETPQGQLASSTTAILGNVNDTFLQYTNQVDPAFAQGRMQDAIARIYFLERNPSEPTAVQCLCTGLVGVSIPVGALAIAQDGNIYTCTQQGTIPASGNITLSFVCNVVGPVECPASTLNAIYQSIPGWDTINNPSDGVVGVNEETRQAFEARRAASVAKNSIGSLPSVRGAVLSVAAVLDAYVTENVNATTSVVGGVSLAPKSLYVAAVGGAVADIARAIWSKKAPGCGYNGNTTVIVQDTVGYNVPFPSYSVTFEIPGAVSILYVVSIANNSQVPSNAAVLIQNAIINDFNGGAVLPRASIGDTIFASRYYADVANLGSWVQLISIFVSSINSATATFNGAIAGTTLTITGGITGTVAIGQTLVDAASLILPGTTIISGSGLSWQVSNSQTVALEAMATAKPTLVQTPTNINQVPTISANNIAVSLI